MKKLLMMLLVLFSLSFAAAGDADWQVLAFIAAFIALMVLIMLYMFSYLADSREMRLLATKELYQVIVALFFIAVFSVVEITTTELIATPLAESFTADDAGITNLIEAAIMVSDGMASYFWEYTQTITTDVTMQLGSLASLSGTCSFLGTSFTYPGCIGIQVPYTSMSLATTAMVSALLVQNSQTMLLILTKTFLFPVLLPLGIFLRTFQFTRGAGGFLMAIGVAFYFIYPLSVIATKGMLDAVEMRDPVIPYIDAPTQDYDAGSWDVSGDCNPFDMDPSYTQNQVDNVLDDDFIDPLLFYYIVGGLFTTMLNLMITLSAVRGLASIFGAEVDISGLARIS